VFWHSEALHCFFRFTGKGTVLRNNVTFSTCCGAPLYGLWPNPQIRETKLTSRFYALFRGTVPLTVWMKMEKMRNLTEARVWYRIVENFSGSFCKRNKNYFLFTHHITIQLLQTVLFNLTTAMPGYSVQKIGLKHSICPS
jgi:hypothetical protein